jgi:hypothetical protein
MKLPNGDQAVIPIQKLTGYCLNPNHSKGKHKARVFQAVLNITADNADVLLALIQQAAIEGDVVQQDPTPQGQIFKVDWEIPNTNGEQLRTTWEIAHNTETPRLVTAFIK